MTAVGLGLRIVLGCGFGRTSKVRKAAGSGDEPQHLRSVCTGDKELPRVALIVDTDALGSDKSMERGLVSSPPTRQPSGRHGFQSGG